MKKLLLSGLVWLAALAAWAQGPTLTVSVTVHNVGSTTLETVDANVLNGGAYSIPTIGGAYILAGASQTFALDREGYGGDVWYSSANYGPTYIVVLVNNATTTATASFSPSANGTFDVYFNDAGVTVAPAPTNSLFCVTINNTSGTGNSYGIANIDTGVVLTLDACGDNEQYVPAGQSAQICVVAASTNNVALVTEIGGGSGSQGTQVAAPGGGRAAGGCGSMQAYDPDFTGTIASTNLIGTPIANGAPASSVTNNNGGGSLFAIPGVNYTDTNGGAAGPITFNGSGSGLASNATMVVGFDAVFAELVNAVNAVGKLDADVNADLAAIKGVDGSILSGQAAGNSLLTTDTGYLASLVTGIGTLNSSLGAVTSGVQQSAGDLAQLTNQMQAQGVNLSGISNLLVVADNTLGGISNGIALIVSNTGGINTSLSAMSNYATAALALTNAAMGALSANWSDGANIAALTNNAYVAGTALGMDGLLNTSGTAAQGAANSRGLGPVGGEDDSFWSINAVVGGITYSYDLNPMDNAGIASLAALVRNWEQWLLCFWFLFLVMRVFDKYMASLAATQQLQANRIEVLGNSVGQLSAAVYMPIMIGVMVAIPLFIASAISGTAIGSAAFAAITTPPWGSGTLVATLGQSLWLADQFIPINFFIATLLWYVFIRLCAAPIWAGALVLQKSLLS